MSKEAVAAERRYEKETSTCMQVAFRARTYLLSPLPLPPPHPPLTDAIREAGWLCFLPPPLYPCTPHAEFVWLSASSAKSEDGLYLGAQKCCSWIWTAFVIMYEFDRTLMSRVKFFIFPQEMVKIYAAANIWTGRRYFGKSCWYNSRYSTGETPPI
jgi:hypothetical protein